VVVIDGSTDDTERALRARYAGDARVIVIVAPRGGASAARNIGFRAAAGAYVCFLDSDDHWLPGTLAVFEQIFSAHPQLAFASIDGSTIPRAGEAQITHLVAVDSPGWTHARFAQAAPPQALFVLAGESSGRRFLHGDFFPAIILGDLFYLSGMVMRRDAAATAGPFTERFRYFNDWEFFARLCLQGSGAYLDYDGFRRDTGRPDQISRRRPATSMPRRHVYILRSLPRRFPHAMTRYTAPSRLALDDAHYMLGRMLAGSTHRAWARRYLARCLGRGYKPARSLALLLATFLRK
jgi:glycosyltransferase involved in cell wall biosynthesis